MTEQNGTLSYPVDRIDELLDKIAKLDITTLLGCEFEGNTRWYASGEDVVIGQVKDHTYASVKIPVKEGMRFSVDVDSSIFGLPSWYTTDAKGVVINVGNTIYANSATSINIEEGAEAYLYVNNYIGNDYNPQVLLYHSIGQILDILGEKPDTKDVVTELNKKVNKVDGKQLSTEDFTTAMKNKLNQAATTTQLSQQLEALNNTYAKKKGTEPDLIAGYAEKLVGTAVGGCNGPSSNGVVYGRIGTIDGTLSNFLADIGLGCYLVKDNHNRTKLLKTNHSKNSSGGNVSLDGSRGQYMWGWDKPFYYCVKVDDNGILTEEKFAYTPMKGYLCWKIPAATISAFNGAVIDRGEDGTKYKLVSVVNNTERYRAFDTPLNISGYTAEVNGGYGYIADSSNSRLRLFGTFSTLLLDGYDDNWGISWDWFYYIAYALMRATLGCADVQSTSAPLTPVSQGYDIVQRPSDEKSLYPGLMSYTGAPSNNSDWQSLFRCHCLYPTSAGIGDGTGDITGYINFNGPDGARYSTAAFYGWKNPYGHMPYIKYGHKLLFLNNENMVVTTLNNKGVGISSKPIPNPIMAEQVANGYTITGLSTEGLMGYPGSVKAVGLNTFYGDSITANNSVVGSTAFINNVQALIATEISGLKAGMASIHLIKETDSTVNTEKYGAVPYTIALCESDEPFNYEPIQY